MANPHVCPWWMGYLLLTPLRRWGQNPAKILSPFVKPGMTILEPGPGMGFFTLELAKLSGPGGRVIAVDIQEKMLRGLMKRAKRAGLSGRIEVRRPTGTSLEIGDLKECVDFVLAFAVVHELPDAQSFYREAYHALKPGGQMLVAEPKGHVDAEAWQKQKLYAAEAGFAPAKAPTIARSVSALYVK